MCAPELTEISPLQVRAALCLLNVVNKLDVAIRGVALEEGIPSVLDPSRFVLLVHISATGIVCRHE